MNQKREKLTEQFHPITATEARQWFKDGLLTVVGYLWAIRQIKCKPTVNFVIPNVTIFCEEWGISKAGFYRAVKQLEAKGYMKWEATHGLIFTPTKKVISFDKSKSVSDLRHDSQIRDTQSQIRDTQSQIRDTQSQIRDSGIYIDHARISDNSDKQTLSDSTSEFSAFLAGLVDEREREKFLDFGRKKAANLPEPPELPDRWVAKYHLELYAQFKASETAATPATDEISQAEQQKREMMRKQAEEFLSEQNTDPDRDKKCVPAPQKSAAQPQETVEEAEVSNQPEKSAKESKTGGQSFGIDKELINRIKARNKKAPKPTEQELDQYVRTDVAPPHD